MKKVFYQMAVAEFNQMEKSEFFEGLKIGLSKDFGIFVAQPPNLSGNRLLNTEEFDSIKAYAIEKLPILQAIEWEEPKEHDLFEDGFSGVFEVTLETKLKYNLEKIVFMNAVKDFNSRNEFIESNFEAVGKELLKDYIKRVDQIETLEHANKDMKSPVINCVISDMRQALDTQYDTITELYSVLNTHINQHLPDSITNVTAEMLYKEIEEVIGVLRPVTIKRSDYGLDPKEPEFEEYDFDLEERLDEVNNPSND
ncbi:hypothetical protein [Vibrio harveyi]|uniref:hypothetical protein n=1 Tax=Vibrio harveyi TaxID=669 RepID=UPI002380620C|nr:hypothetical protein [Vibrio harveyi]